MSASPANSVISARSPAPKRARHTSTQKRHAIEAWLILTPILIYYSVFFLFPVVANFYVSFTRWNGIQGAPQWVGLKNYRQYLTRPYPLIIFNTLLFAVARALISSPSVSTIIAPDPLVERTVLQKGSYRSMRSSIRWFIR